MFHQSSLGASATGAIAAKCLQIGIWLTPSISNACLRLIRQRKWAFCRDFKPSDGLEPSTPSLPWNVSGNRWQPVARDLACFCGFEGRPICR